MNVRRSALLPYSAAQIFAVINDINSYPEFLNWCDKVRMLEEFDDVLIAELGIAYGRLKFTFATRNESVLDQSIDMQLVSGPFRNLSGKWLIEALNGDACKVSLTMDFTFNNPITHRLFGKVFQSVVSTQVDAFQKRAAQIYGEP